MSHNRKEWFLSSPKTEVSLAPLLQNVRRGVLEGPGHMNAAAVGAASILPSRACDWIPSSLGTNFFQTSLQHESETNKQTSKHKSHLRKKKEGGDGGGGEGGTRK